MLQSDLFSFSVKGKKLLPIVQGGMGVGVSAHRLAGAVGKEGAMGSGQRGRHGHHRQH